MIKSVATEFRRVRRGERLRIALQAAEGQPPFTGAETVTFDVKRAFNNDSVPPDNAPALLSIMPVFVAADASWEIFVMPAQTAVLPVGIYISDAKVVFGPDDIEWSDPIGIYLIGRVTV